MQSDYRTRTRGGFHNSTVTWAWYTNTPPSTWNSAVIGPSYGTEGVMGDYVVKRFKERSRNGEIFNNPCSRSTKTMETSTYGPMFMAVINPTTRNYGDLRGPHWTSGILSDPSLPAYRPQPTVSIANLRALASTRVHSNISPPDFDGFVNLGEVRETLQYLRNPVKAGLKLADTLEKRLRWVEAQRFSFNKDRVRTRQNGKIRKDLADIHLSVIFGFKPIVTEFAKAMENLHSRSMPRPVRKTARSKETRVWTDSWVQSESASGIPCTAAYTFRQETTVRCGILYEQGVEVTTAEKWGLRPRDIVPALYALAPLSFVLDYFVNAADLIQSVVPKAGEKELSSWTTEEVTTTMTRKTYGFKMSQPGWTTIRDGTGEEKVTTVSYKRTPGIEMPSLAIKDLDILANDVGKLSSLLSLLTTRLTNSQNTIERIQRVRRNGATRDASDWIG